MAEDPRIELVHNPRQVIPAALNIGLGAVRGRWLVRMDAHSTVGPRLRRRTRWPGCGRVAGAGWAAARTASARPRAGSAIAAALGSRFGVGGSLYHYGTTEQPVDHIPFGAYPTELRPPARRLGRAARGQRGLRVRLPAPPQRRRCSCSTPGSTHLVAEPADRPRRSTASTAATGPGKVDVARLHPDSLRLRHLAPPLLVPYLVTRPRSPLRRPRLGAALLAPYAAGLTAASVRTAPRARGPRGPGVRAGRVPRHARRLGARRLGRAHSTSLRGEGTHDRATGTSRAGGRTALGGTRLRPPRHRRDPGARRQPAGRRDRHPAARPAAAPLNREPDITVRFVDELPDSGPDDLRQLAGERRHRRRTSTCCAARTAWPPAPCCRWTPSATRCEIVCERRGGPRSAPARRHQHDRSPAGRAPPARLRVHRTTGRRRAGHRVGQGGQDRGPARVRRARRPVRGRRVDLPDAGRRDARRARTDPAVELARRATP